MREIESKNINSGGRFDADLLEASPSAGWRATYAIMHARLDQVEAATRTDRSERYRQKHWFGVSS